ncbi:MAG: glutathione S-transferase N-terminal domain-containing protein, partial [Sphingomonadales bacterium]|nr:glutathione S-transferase N-terminal domain-containing protein [Sphingomonadales bacterium]
MPEKYKNYEIYGVDPSYFTQKVLAFFAYKQIPFSYIHKTFDKAEMIEKNAGTKLIPVVKMPDDSWGYDSTPLAFEMDRRFPERQLLPDDDALAFVVRIIEDYFDEWLTRQAVHFRWHYAADRRVGGGGIVRNVMGLGVDDDIAEPL